ncbi:MAG TPA: alpha/beta hydrolase [Longimicrobium sp.]|nr:alpha/beta hydrolase [Longimicrobium sp.]
MADGTRVEYLDWGGRGEVLVFVAGLGNTAHVFDTFAPRFTGRYRVIGVTRRGFGGSDRPAQGYEPAVLATDIVAVLDSLGVRRATLIGHSIGGGEITAVAAAHPGRVRRLVYLDSYNFGCHARAGARPARAPRAPGTQPAGLFVSDPARTALTSADSVSAAAMHAAYTRKVGWSFPIDELRAQREEGTTGARAAGLGEGGMMRAIMSGARACHPDVRQPALGVFADVQPRWEAFDEQRRPVQLTPEQERVETHDLRALVQWDRDRFRAQVPNSRTVLIPGAHHFIFLSNPDRVYREVRTFLAATRDRPR